MHTYNIYLYIKYVYIYIYIVSKQLINISKHNTHINSISACSKGIVVKRTEEQKKTRKHRKQENQ